jgi:hypothetical protein
MSKKKVNSQNPEIKLQSLSNKKILPTKKDEFLLETKGITFRVQIIQYRSRILFVKKRVCKRLNEGLTLERPVHTLSSLSKTE